MKMRLLAILLCAAMLLGLVPAGAETVTQVSLTIYGLTGLGDGSFEREKLVMQFDLSQNGEKIGTLTTSDGSMFTLPTADALTLTPVSDTEGWQISRLGYVMPVTPGVLNQAAIEVYARAGLFAVTADPGARFTLTAKEEGAEPVEYTADENGQIVPERAVPAGDYLLADAEGLYLPVEMTVVTYTGDASQILRVQADSASLQPVPADGTLTVALAGDTAEEPTPAATLSGSGGSWDFTLPAELTLAGGDYTLSVTLPEGYGAYEPLQRQVSVTAGSAAEITLTLYRPAAVEAGMDTIPDGRLLLTGAAGNAEGALRDGFCRIDGLVPGDYTVSLSLPDGLYEGEGWSLTPADGALTATMTLTLAGGETAFLPGLTRIEAVAADEETREAEAPAAAEPEVPVTNEAPETSAEPETPDAPETLAEPETPDVPETPEEDAPDTLALPTAAEQAALEREAAWADKLSADRKPVYVAPRDLPKLTGVTGTGTGTISVQVFNDGNRDSQMNNSERGLPGALVTLIKAAGPEGEGIVASRTAEGDCIVTFGELPAGVYLLQVTLPEGFAFTDRSEKRMTLRQNIMEATFARTGVSEALTLGTGETVECAAGGTATSTVSGRVWQDDGDGAMEEGEPGFAGVLMEAESIRTGARVQTVTDEDGRYTILQLKPGDYYLRCYLPDGQMFTVNNTKVNNRLRTVIGGEGRTTGRKNLTVERGGNVTDQNVGLIPGASVQVVAFVDENYNGAWDEGEAPLPGVTAFLMRQANGNELSNVTTDASGVASFGALRTNTYKVKTRIPEGWHYTFRGTGEYANRFYEPDRRDDVLNNVTVTDAGQTITLYAGAIQYATISGVVYIDQNFSGTMEDNERRLENLTLALLGEDHLVKATAKTNARGEYLFSDILPGTYTMTLTSLAEHAFTVEGEGNVMINRGAGAGSTDPFWLGSGENRTGMNAGMIRPAKLQGIFYADLNDNGRQDAGEGRLEGAKVVLTGEDGSETVCVPGEDGNFVIDSIMPGVYGMRWDLPEDAVFCEVPDDMVREGSSLRYRDTFALSSGNVGTFLPVGAISLARVSGTVFSDPDANGVTAGGEGLSGATVTLTPAREGMIPVTCVSAADGSFVLDGLRPGVWQLTVELPEGLVLSRLADVTLPLTTGLQTQTAELSVEMGARFENQMLGAVQPAVIRGLAWLDENNDGKYEAEEAALAGETVFLVDLTDSGEGVPYAEAAVAEDGSFVFEGVIPGVYRLEYALTGQSVPADSGDSTFTLSGDRLVMDGLRPASGETLDGLCLGVKRYTSLGGHVWFDQGGELVPVEGAAVQWLNAEGAVGGETATDAEGNWRFDGLMPGEYRVSVTFPEGTVPVEPGDARLGDGLVSVLTELNGRTGLSGVILLHMGEDQLSLDAGSVSAGSLGDLVWLDLNGDGLQASDEGGIPGVTVHLWRNGAEVAQTQTDQYGFFRFTGLYPAAYTMSVDVTGVMPTVLRSDIPGIVSVMGGDGFTVPVTVLSGTHNYNADMGFIPLTEGSFPAGYGEGETQIWK